MAMSKAILSALGCLVFGATAAVAQHTTPKFLFIYRDSLKTGGDSAYRAIENDGAQICADLKCANPYLGLESLTGPHEAWWINAFDDDADTVRVSRAYAGNRPLLDALGDIARRKQAMIGTPVQGFAMFRGERSHGAGWPVAGARFVVATVTRGGAPSAGPAWVSADSTVYAFRFAQTRRQADAMAGPSDRILAIRPNWSMPAPAWAAADREFWREAPRPR